MTDAEIGGARPRPNGAGGRKLWGGMAKLLHIRCPGCGTEITVDAASGAVLEHRRPGKKASLDLEHANEQLKRQEEQRNRRFEESVQAERHRDELLGQKFKEALRRAREDPTAPPPPRDVDLD